MQPIGTAATAAALRLARGSPLEADKEEAPRCVLLLVGGTHTPGGCSSTHGSDGAVHRHSLRVRSRIRRTASPTMASAGIAPDESVCLVCFDSHPPPIQSGCACRSGGGLAHVGCLIEKAVSQPHRGDAAWYECQTCKQQFTGAMRTGLAEAWWSRVSDQVEETEERLCAAGNLASCRRRAGQFFEAERIEREVLAGSRRVHGEEHPNTLTSAANLAQSLSCQGQYAEAERIYRDVLGVSRRVLGEEHPNTLTTAGNLAMSLSDQGKYVDAERITREVLGVRRRVLGEVHPDTLATANILASSLSYQGAYVEAERINRGLLGVMRRVLGEEHPNTLTTAGNLASSLSGQGKYADAERINREVLGVERRVLGELHPDTLATASNLASSLLYQGKHAEAERILHVVFATQQRVLGADHPSTLSTADGLQYCRSQMRAGPPTRTGGSTGTPTARAIPHRLPAGTRVLVQRLVAKPEYNGKPGRVLSFDERGGRYAVVLDDGKELLLKPESVARAGCAAAGCASEEASRVCARCQAVRYCSRDCQRADWKAHKLTCTAAHPQAATGAA